MLWKSAIAITVKTRGITTRSRKRAVAATAMGRGPVVGLLGARASMAAAGPPTRMPPKLG